MWVVVITGTEDWAVGSSLITQNIQNSNGIEQHKPYVTISQLIHLALVPWLHKLVTDLESRHRRFCRVEAFFQEAALLLEWLVPSRKNPQSDSTAI